MIKSFLEKGLYMFFLVPNTSSEMQMMDQAPNREHERSYNRKVEQWIAGHKSEKLSKPIAVGLFVEAAHEVLTEGNFRAGWKKVGMDPWDPSVINTIPATAYGRAMIGKLPIFDTKSLFP
jgi:hypothetical protein